MRAITMSAATSIKHQIRILLVDDHTILRQGLAGLLGDEPDMVIVGEAANGLEAVELARQLHPDVVTMDITMPVMNGIEATRQITRELPQTRVIGLSMHTSEDMEAQIEEAGAATYLPKDGPFDALTAAIRAQPPQGSV